MKLTILGNTGPYPRAGGACSGYLLENEDAKIILDMGPGTLANALSVCALEDISAIVISHLHEDHCSDLGALHYALEMKGLRVPLYAPAKPEAVHHRIAAMSAFTIQDLTAETTLHLGGLDLTFCEMRHPVQDFATKATDGKWTFMYTGDTAMCPSFKAFTKGVQVLLCDCAFLEDHQSDKHLSVPEAVAVANDAGVRHLIMTHFNPEIRAQRYFEIANDTFKGRASNAEIMAKINL